MTDRRRAWAARLPAVLAGAGTVFVAATAFVLAYGGSKGAALDAGISPDAAGWYPLCIEGALVVASVSTVILRGRERAAAWLVLLLFVAVSTAANVLHSLDHGAGHWWSPYAAAVPPLSLPICTWLAERVALSTLHVPLTAGGRAATAPVGLDSAGPVTPPGRTSGDRVDGAARGASTVAESLPAASGPVDATPPGVHRTALATIQPTRPDSGPDASDESGGTASDAGPDSDQTVRLAGHRKQSGRRTGRTAGHRTGRPAGRSPERPVPDWREVDWAAVAVARGVQKSQAYAIMKAEPDAVRVAREQLYAMNGSAP